MKRLAFAIVLALGLAACGQSQGPGAQGAAPADTAAGKAYAERNCKGCHGVDGKGVAPAIPHLAAQRESYLLGALQAYKAGKRTHAALKEVATEMSANDMRNIAAFYASLPAVQTALPKDVGFVSPYEQGKKLSEPCAKCHGEDGNSRTSGVPTLAGQQPHYMVIAIQEYLQKERMKAPMHDLLPGLKKRDLESIAIYFASQTPVLRGAPAAGNAMAGEALTGVCGGCHGSHGISVDSATPKLAGQDPKYLVEAIKSYRTSLRQREAMRAYITGLSEKQIEDIAAFYSIQNSGPAEKGQTLVHELADKCERCHGAAAQDNPAMAVPKINGQDRDYLVMALRAYRDDRRDSSTMHRMSLPYSDSIIESLATAYARQPAK
ncbi:MAG TPA: c-type cytochrome [Burkholderiales bacterium]